MCKVITSKALFHYICAFWASEVQVKWHSTETTSQQCSRLVNLGQSLQTIAQDRAQDPLKEKEVYKQDFPFELKSVVEEVLKWTNSSNTKGHIMHAMKIKLKIPGTQWVGVLE